MWTSWEKFNSSFYISSFKAFFFFTFYHGRKQKCWIKTWTKIKTEAFYSSITDIMKCFTSTFLVSTGFCKMSTEWQITQYSFALVQAGQSHLTSITWGWPKGKLNYRATVHYFSWTKPELLLQKLLGLLRPESRRGLSDHQCCVVVSPKSRVPFCQAPWPFALATVCRTSASHPHALTWPTHMSVPGGHPLLLCSGSHCSCSNRAPDGLMETCGHVLCSSGMVESLGLLFVTEPSSVPFTTINAHFSIVISSVRFCFQCVLELFLE